MKQLLKILIAVVIVFNAGECTSQTNNTGVQKVVIIRHGEKNDQGDNLSCKGLNRSLLLPAVLYNKYKLPDKIFVPSVNNGKSASQLRMLETITPFAIKYNINIDTKYDVDDAKDLADAVLKTKGYALIIWEHKNIHDVAKALGVNDKGIKWDDNDFDSIWVIDFKNGKGTLTMDKENINPPDACR